MRIFLGIIAGLATGIIVTMLSEKIGHIIAPPPEPFNAENMEAFKEFMANLPIAAWLLMIAGWALSSFLGGLVAGKIAQAKWATSALIVGAILMILSISNYVMIPHPTWVPVVSLCLYLPMAYLGGKLGGKGYST